MFRRQGQVLIGTIVGLVNLDRLLKIRAMQCAEWALDLPRGTVLDYRGASFDLTHDQREFAYEVGRRWTYKLNRPTCVVGRSDQMSDFATQCERWARHGVVAAAFTDLPPAIAWASARREAQIRIC